MLNNHDLKIDQSNHDYDFYFNQEALLSQDILFYIEAYDIKSCGVTVISHEFMHHVKI